MARRTKDFSGKNSPHHHASGRKIVTKIHTFANVKNRLYGSSSRATIVLSPHRIRDHRFRARAMASQSRYGGTLNYSPPGKPVNSASTERLIGKIGVECLNANWRFCFRQASRIARLIRRQHRLRGAPRDRRASAHGFAASPQSAQLAARLSRIFRPDLVQRQA